MKNYLEFIEKHVLAELVKKGYTPSVARSSAYRATEHYKHAGSTSGKSKMFADCLHVAEVWAKQQQPKIKGLRV
ncbi:hypothetical protein [Candidatus Hamiltonella defensa]|uniref:hypothetical protein n=1 Tax=Candidatus Williamhamiltonella defendens TaxID=138072 RepID=UPI001583D4CF|nr:hypothetical protein [Candidatus Hamiltonella defensa]